MDNLDESLREIYFNLGEPGAFSGPVKLYHSAKENIPGLTKKDVIKWLQGQWTFTIQTQPKRRIKRPKVMAPFRHYQWEADTANMKSYVKDNKGYNHFLVIIDVFSRFVWTFPVKSTTGKETAQIFKQLFSKLRPWRVRTDKGSEFKNRFVREVMGSHGVLHIFTHNEVKAAFAERVIKTLKTILSRYRLLKQSNRFTSTCNKNL